MSTGNPESRNRTRRLLRVLGAVMVPAVAIVALAVPASADQQCRSFSSGVVCLTINRLSDGQYAVDLGIDVHMSRQDAQAIIDAPGDPFTAKVVGADTFFDNDLFGVPMVGIGATDESGLSADFHRVVLPSSLNEDDSPGDRVDEVFGRIRFVDPRTNLGRTFDTPEIHALF
ncbi:MULTISPECIES: hypothetical protein [Streptosporangium]|uniref:Tat pathway signal sequence domain protein n=1 Tax=Streptosporangium brasiliense TaxID=47480 RepID=A0ABT9RDG8_9ACTN|nr:hypothetical protein [Streptosporangium brasiliense]MDP9866794.1 hypothetical protein [Streptosporangium brasiliense]